MQVTSRILEEGFRNLTMQFTGIGDGTDNETNVLKIDVSQLNPPCESVRIMKVQYDVAYGVVQVLWDALTPVEAMHLDGFGKFDYHRQGGLHMRDRVSVVGATGDILFSTKGFELNSTYTITLEMKKKGVNFTPGN